MAQKYECDKCGAVVKQRHGKKKPGDRFIVRCTEVLFDDDSGAEITYDVCRRCVKSELFDPQ